jgi:hypothetical protein
MGADASRALLVAAQTMTIDVMSAEVARALERHGVPALLLRGPALARWLYADGEARSYVDADLLVPPGGMAAAGEALDDLGFRCWFDDRTAADLRMAPHAQTWFRARDNATLDLHWTVGGLRAAPEAVWAELSARRASLRVGGAELRVPDEGALALVVALHAAVHGTGKTKPAEDLDRALARADDAVWREAWTLARALDGESGFVAGVAARPAGNALLRRLGVDATPSVEAALLAGSHRPGTVPLIALSRARGRARLRVAARAAFPPPEYLRVSHPIARRGRLGLTAGYAVRLLRGAWGLPGAGRAVLRTRRAR